MPILIDPITGQRVVYAKHSGDIVYDLISQTGKSVAVKEDIPVIGGWKDYSGSGGQSSKALLMWAGIDNEFQCQRSQIEGKEDHSDLTNRGKRKKTHRSRIIKRYKGL